MDLQANVFINIGIIYKDGIYSLSDAQKGIEEIQDIITNEHRPPAKPYGLTEAFFHKSEKGYFCYTVEKENDGDGTDELVHMVACEYWVNEDQCWRFSDGKLIFE